MADFFGTPTSDGRSESSMVDSIMMPILHSAMNRAHDRVRSRDGVLQRLAEQSKFCDLAVMQLDACVSCLQSADDDRGFHRETTAYHKLVSDLTEIRARLFGRLKETERAIADKDKELQRLRNYVRNQRSRKDEEKEHSKEEKNILEEKKKADSEREKGGGDNKSKTVQDCDQMGSEINSLKRTLDVAMLVMQNAISVPEVRPFDLQFCWEMEKEIMTTLLAGFVSDFQFRSEEESVRIRENWSPLGACSLSGLMDEFLSLRCELESLSDSIAEVDSRNSSPKNRGKGKGAMDEFKDDGVNKVSIIIGAHESIIKNKIDKLDELQRCIKGLTEKLDSLSKWNDKMDSLFSCCDDKSLNHESEISVNTLEYDKSISERSLREKDAQELDLQVEITEEIQNILLRSMMKDFQKHMHDNDIGNFITNGVCKDILHETVKDLNKSIKTTNIRDKYRKELNIQAVIAGEIQNILLRCVIKDFQQHMHHQLKGLISVAVNDEDKYTAENNMRDNNDVEELKLRLMITGEVQSIILKCAMNDFQQQMHDRELMSLIREGRMHDHELMSSITEGRYMDLLRETTKNEMNKNTEKMDDKWKHNMENCTIDTFLREEIYEQVFKEALKCITSELGEILTQNKELRTICSSLIASETRLHIDSTVKENVYTTLLKEMANNQSTETDEVRFKNTIEKEVYQLSILDTLKNTCASMKRNESTNVEIKGNNSFIEKLDSLLCCVEDDNSLSGFSCDNEKHDNEQFIVHGSEQEVLMIEAENNREMDFNSTCDKFKKALMQLGRSKMLLKDLGSEHEVETSDDDTNDSQRSPYHQRESSTVQLREERKHHTLCLEEIKGSKFDHLSDFGFSLGEYSQLTANLEHHMHQTLDFNSVRIERLKRELLQLVRMVAPLKRKESLYRQAFIRRCENLQKAETEVDILGDQVNALLTLLERIYAAIQYHAPALQQCSGVLNILPLIRKELNGVTA